MNEIADIYKNGTFHCHVEILNFIPPVPTYTTVGPFIGNPTIEKIPGKINPGQLKFTCELKFLGSFMTPDAAYAKWEIHGGKNRRPISIYSVSNNVVRAVIS